MRYEKIDNIVYGQIGELELKATLYLPATEIRSEIVVIDVHGGAWSSGSRGDGQRYDHAMAESGICVLAIDFRQGPEHQHPAASADVCCAIRFIKAAVEQFGFNPGCVGLVGSSSGGHLALLAGLLPDSPEHATSTPARGAGTDSAVVDFVIALWPVSNPLGRYQYVTARLPEADQTRPVFTPDRLAAGHRAYFSSEADMDAATIQRIVSRREFAHLPSLLIVQPELDQNVPEFMSQTLAGAWLLAGGNVSYQRYPDVGHGFAHKASSQTDICIKDMIRYIKQRGGHYADRSSTTSTSQKR